MIETGKNDGIVLGEVDCCTRVYLEDQYTSERTDIVSSLVKAEKDSEHTRKRSRLQDNSKFDKRTSE
jgi:hypothetical protein